MPPSSSSSHHVRNASPAGGAVNSNSALNSSGGSGNVEPPPYREPPPPPPGSHARGGPPIPTSPTQLRRGGPNGALGLPPSASNHPYYQPHSPTPPRGSEGGSRGYYSAMGGRPPHYSPPPNHRELRGAGSLHHVKSGSPGRSLAHRSNSGAGAHGMSPARGHTSPPGVQRAGAWLHVSNFFKIIIELLRFS